MPPDLTNDQKQLRSYDLSRAYVAADGIVKITPLALAQGVVVNGDDTTKTAPGPLNNTKVTGLTSYNSLPVVTVDGQTTVYVLVKTDGSGIITNGDIAINDAGGANEAESIAAVASSEALQFAAVSANGGTWGNPVMINRGIAVLAPASDGKSLEVHDATDFSIVGAANKAQKLSLLPADRRITFTEGAVAPAAQLITTADLGDTVAMHWDSSLQRLYLDLSNVGRRQNELAKEGGCLGVALVRVNTNAVTRKTALAIQPIVYAVKKALFYADENGKAEANVNDRIVGFYYDGVNQKGAVLPNGGIVANAGNADVNVSILQSRTMHTSTGKSYLIVNSNIGDGTQAATIQGVFALPLLGTKKADGATVIAETQVGTLSKVAQGIATFNEPPVTYGEMLSANDSAARVGGTEILPADKITHLFVEGDTVYASINGNISAEKGIFASAALFNTNGAVRAWTPWQRVMGAIDKVWGSGLDTSQANFYYLTNDANKNVNTAKVTQWGRSDDVNAGNLSSLLESIFPKGKNGVVGMFSFDQFTPGFAVPASFAMTVVLGPDKVALIQTGRAGNTGIELETQFAIGQNVFVFQGGALAEIAPLTCAEVSRLTINDAGWLFVGGYNGIAVLSLDDGSGWASGTAQVPAQNGLDQLLPDGAGHDEFPGGTSWTFKRLVSDDGVDAFKYVRKLIASNGNLNVLTSQSLRQFAMDANKFSNAPQLLADIVDGSLTGKILADAVVLNSANNDRFVVGTSKGIYGGAFGAMQKETEINSFVAQLQLLGSDRGVTPASGNIYALIADFENRNDKVYRLDVVNNNGNLAVNTIKYPNTSGQFVEFYSAKQGIDSDGTFVYSTLPKNYDQCDYLDLYAISQTGVREVANITELLNVDTCKDSMVTGVMRDGVSGAIQVPGEWGVRVNQ